MTRNVKAVILGAGPSGMACAIALQRAGIPNCAVDRAVFPRAKTCGGLVTEKTLRLFRGIYGEDAGLPPSVFPSESREIALFDGLTMLAHSSAGVPFRLVDRTLYDYALVERYRSLGGTLLEGQTRYEIDYGRRCLRLADGEELRWEYLVFADGVHSRAVKDLHLKAPALCFCLETFLPPEAMETFGLEIHFGCIPAGKYGYLWVFPREDRICVGLGASYQKDLPYRQILVDFLKSRGVSDAGLTLRGAFVPAGGVTPLDRVPENVFLVGDAGGYVDPIYGEGLYYALVSGSAAADALRSADPRREFLKAMEPHARMIRRGLMEQRLLRSPAFMRIALKRIRGKDGFLKYYADNQVSLFRYPHLHPGIMRDYKREKEGTK